jgi:hypothetical protein
VGWGKGLRWEEEKKQRPKGEEETSVGGDVDVDDTVAGAFCFRAFVS